MIHASLGKLAVPVDSLSPMSGNPRIGDVDAVAASLDRFGQRKPIVVRASDRTIVAGNHTWKAAQQLLGEVKVDCLWTDPPYGVDIQELDIEAAKARNRRTDGLGVTNDNLTPDKLEDFLRSALGAAWGSSNPGAAWYVASPGGDLFHTFGTVLRELEVWRHTLIWAKDQFVMGRADYHYQHEPIFYGWKQGAAHHWLGDRKQTTILNFARPKRSPEHPTMKPIELVAYCLNNSAPKGGLVLDPFGGSGSTLMACEYTGRKGRLIELDPKYVDVICRRWQEHTGSLPILESNSMTHDFTKD